MPDDLRSVAPALRIFLWSRAAIWLLAVVAVVGFESRLNPGRGEWDSAAAPRPRGGDRRVGPLGQRLVPPDRAQRLFLALQHAGILPALPVPRRGSRVGVRGPHRPGRRRRLAGRRCGRVRAALSAHVRAAWGGCSAANSALPRARPDLALLRRRLQRVALPPARGGDIPRSRSGGGSGAQGPRRVSRSSPVRPGLHSCPRSSCSPGGPRTGAARSPESPSRPRCSRSIPSCSPCGSAIRSRSSTRRRSSGNAGSRRPARSEASSRRSSTTRCSISPSPAPWSPSASSPGAGSVPPTVSTPSLASRFR